MEADRAVMNNPRPAGAGQRRTDVTVSQRTYRKSRPLPPLRWLASSGLGDASISRREAAPILSRGS